MSDVCDLPITESQRTSPKTLGNSLVDPQERGPKSGQSTMFVLTLPNNMGVCVHNGPTGIDWNSINSVSDGPGVYAWYYRPRFTRFDRDALERSLEEEPSSALIEDFLERHLLRYFEETPYEATIQGPLKARYAGSLYEQRFITPNLSQRLSEDRTRRMILWDALESMVPYFAAPLYIGMAGNLRSRLSQHKRLIEARLENYGAASVLQQGISQDQSFADEVVRRRLATERLSVYILLLPPEAAATVADVENLLNRINHPVLGRN